MNHFMSTESEIAVSKPTHYNFDEYLPWACKRLQLDATIFITKIQQNEYDSARSDKSKVKRKSKTKLLPVRPDLSSDGKSTYTYNLSDTVKIFTIYDNTDNLVQLKFDNNREMSRPVLKVIGLIVQFQPYLTNITVNSGLSNPAMYELKNWLSSSNITDLCLDDAEISDANYDVLLENESLLKQLSLSRCKIDDDVMKRIAANLIYPSPASKTLSILNLTSNKIADTGAKCLAEALRTNRQLAYINLADNLITDEGSEAILDVLNEFLVSSDEFVSSKSRLINYLKERNELISQLIIQLKSGDYDRKSRRKSMRPASVATNYSARQSSIFITEPSIKNIEDIKSQTNLDTLWIERAKTIAENTLGDFTDPFSSDNVNVRDSEVYCYGNNSLACLNLSYNDISYFTVRKLLYVLSYQKMMDRKPRGLVSVTIEGNCIPKNCDELMQIDEILESNLVVRTRQRSIFKKRQSSRVDK